ncbi:MAG TPA: hypothetical protein P5228_10030 [Bacteroidales bacterium]|nr:hypothetical protein [Bacteroidales bacterium]HRZ49598.1 hypothetical protein [Bacteroidales bacterium]
MNFKLLLTILPLLSGLASSAQTDPVSEPKKFGITFKGFVKSDYWYDTRQVVNSREELFLFYPKGVLPDKNGKDINAEDYVNFSPVTSRLTGIITTPDAFGAKATGVIEADFSGVTNDDINGFRLRHAYGKLRWKNAELLFGQFWHPMFVTEVFPNVISLNTGAPFQPFIRNPQISYTRWFGKLNVSLTALSQRDNVNDGPSGMKAIYLRNALVPNIHLQAQYKSGAHVLGVAGDWKKIRPRMTNAFNALAPETVSGLSAMAYWKYTRGNLVWRCKSIYGQNLTDHLLLGGYAVHSLDTLTDQQTYVPTNHLFLWGNIQYGKKIQTGLFVGFAKNFGTGSVNTGKYYARGADIAYLYRIAPSVSWISGPVQVSFEPEYTVAAYGTPDAYGVVQNAAEVANLRLLLTFFYFF